ncbi:hypothetical protein F7230_05500 [Corynebacterium sp. 320]|uniref:Bacterial SCP orthologue domain-containing protein n=1 Tax=Corynebacterium zhongnanshanii TaxID=2768834 RepID=A0ABQ6VCM0_9CORY|nr:MULTISPECIES: sterol carrier family protein [Corynebacterium]KAB1503004.1 hypothetical protein F7230_05500 [Corynebacterium sp. 320]KAB1550786.1 hypothetical protein F7233_09710 [Corynebacterium sp. 321]KAB1551143.1 hypothetical protein F7232_08865 [Corynebacterium sp. 319]KAB3519800.1 hypothetical protein F8377_07710 [Corynebacterium zhongnanshanii]KAB3526801.1 hypothetical protein F8354_05500 [Corynebacterium sp. 250]
MSPQLSGPELISATRDALERVLPWVRDPERVARPGRAEVAQAVRLSIALLGQSVPGHTLEVRVPPFAAVQCLPGPEHRRGTPPNVVQCSPVTWLRLLVGEETLMNSDAEVSGSRASELAKHLPLLRFRG